MQNTLFQPFPLRRQVMPAFASGTGLRILNPQLIQLVPTEFQSKNFTMKQPLDLSPWQATRVWTISTTEVQENKQEHSNLRECSVLLHAATNAATASIGFLWSPRPQADDPRAAQKTTQTSLCSLPRNIQHFIVIAYSLHSLLHGGKVT